MGRLCYATVRPSQNVLMGHTVAFFVLRKGTQTWGVIK